MSDSRLGDSRSSFARSFFQGASGGGGEQEDSHDEQKTGGAANDHQGNASFPMPRSRPSSRRSYNERRRSSSRDSLSMSDLNAAAAAAAAAFGGSDDSSGEPDFHGSWYADALRQQGGTEENLKEILAASSSDVQKEHTNEDGFGDDEVLEQYRIMALHEARHRVKESIGFDIEEYQSENKVTTPVDKRNMYGGIKQPKTRLPEPRRLPPKKPSQVQPEEPPLLPPRPDVKLVQQKSKRVPELQAGTITRGLSQPLSPEEHTVRCLGCRSNLRVNQKATLVSCPDCSVISPASSTRR